MGWHLH